VPKINRLYIYVTMFRGLDLKKLTLKKRAEVLTPLPVKECENEAQIHNSQYKMQLQKVKVRSLTYKPNPITIWFYLKLLT